MLCLNELPGRNVQYWHTLGARPKTVGSPGRRRPMKNRGGRPRPQTTPAESPSKATQQAWLGEPGQAPRFTPEPPGDAGGRGRPDGSESDGDATGASPLEAPESPLPALPAERDEPRPETPDSACTDDLLYPPSPGRSVGEPSPNSQKKKGGLWAMLKTKDLAVDVAEDLPTVADARARQPGAGRNRGEWAVAMGRTARDRSPRRDAGYTAALTRPVLVSKILESGELKLPHRLRDEGALSLAAALSKALTEEKDRPVKTIDIGWNKLSAAAVKATANVAAAPGARVERLLAAGNTVDFFAALEVARVLARQACVLRVLDLQRCGLTDQVVHVLFEVATRNRTLAALNLRENELSDFVRESVRVARQRHAEKRSIHGLKKKDERRGHVDLAHQPNAANKGLSPLLKVREPSHGGGHGNAKGGHGGNHAPGLTLNQAVRRVYEIIEAKAQEDATQRAHHGANAPTVPLAEFVTTWHERRFGGRASGHRKQRELLSLLKVSQHFKGGAAAAMLAASAQHHGAKPGAPHAVQPQDTKRRIAQLLDVLGVASATCACYTPLTGDVFVLLLGRLFKPNHVAKALETTPQLPTYAYLNALMGDSADPNVPATWDNPQLLPLANDIQLLEIVEQLEQLGKRHRGMIHLDDFLDHITDELRAALFELGVKDKADLSWDEFVDLVDYFNSDLSQEKTVELYEELTEKRSHVPLEALDKAHEKASHRKKKEAEATDELPEEREAGEPVAIDLDRLIMALWKSSVFHAADHSSGFEIATKLMRGMISGGGDDDEPPTSPKAGKRSLKDDEEKSALRGRARGDDHDEGRRGPLKKLDLTCCGIGARGALALADVIAERLKVLPKIVDVGLGLNPLGALGARSLLRAASLEDGTLPAASPSSAASKKGATRRFTAKMMARKQPSELRLQLRGSSFDAPETAAELLRQYEGSCDALGLAFADPECVVSTTSEQTFNIEGFEQRAAARRAIRVVARRHGRWFDRLDWRFASKRGSKAKNWLPLTLNRVLPGETTKKRPAPSVAGATRTCFDARRTVSRTGELRLRVGYRPRVATALHCATTAGLKCLQSLLCDAAGDRDRLLELALMDASLTSAQAVELLCGVFYAPPAAAAQWPSGEAAGPARGRDDRRRSARSAARLKDTISYYAAAVKDACMGLDHLPNRADFVDDDHVTMPQTPDVERAVARVLPALVDRSRAAALCRVFLPSARTGRSLRRRLGHAYGPCVGSPNGRYALRLWRSSDRLALRLLLELDDAERRELRVRRGLGRFEASHQLSGDSNLRAVRCRAAAAEDRLRGSAAHAHVLEAADRASLLEALLTAHRASFDLDRRRGEQAAIKSPGNILVHVDYASTSRPRLGVEPHEGEAVLGIMAASSLPAVEPDLETCFLEDDACVCRHAAAVGAAAAAGDARPPPPWLLDRDDADDQLKVRHIQSKIRGLQTRARVAALVLDRESLAAAMLGDASARTSATAKSRKSKGGKKAKGGKKSGRGSLKGAAAAAVAAAKGPEALAASPEPSVASIRLALQTTSQSQGGRRSATGANALSQGSVTSEVTGTVAAEGTVFTVGSGGYGSDGFGSGDEFVDTEGVDLLFVDSGWVPHVLPRTLDQLASRRARARPPERPDASPGAVFAAEAGEFRDDVLDELRLHCGNRGLTVGSLALVVAHYAGAAGTYRKGSAAASHGGAFVADGLRVVDGRRAADVVVALAPSLVDLENLAGDLLLRLPSPVAAEVADRLGLLGVARPPDAHGDARDGFVLGTRRARLDLADADHHAVATAALTVLYRERGASLDGCWYRSGDAWDADVLEPPPAWRGEASSDAKVALEDRETALHKKTSPHDGALAEERVDARSRWSPEQEDLARDSPHCVGLMEALRWSQASNYARSAMMLQKVCRQYAERREIQSSTMAEQIDRNLREYPGLSPILKMIDLHIPERPTPYEEAVACFNAVLRDKISADETCERKRQAKMPFTQFLLKWHTMRYGACYMARTEQGQLLAFVQDFVRHWRHEHAEAHAMTAVTRHAMAPRMRQCCIIAGIAPLQVHLYSPIIAEQYVLLLRRLAPSTFDLERCLDYTSAPGGAARGNHVALDAAIAAVTGSGDRDDSEDEYDDEEDHGVEVDAPSTWDAPILLALTGDAMLLTLVTDIRSKAKRGFVDRRKTTLLSGRESFKDAEKDQRVLETDDLLDTVLKFLLDRASEMHTHLVRIFEKSIAKVRLGTDGSEAAHVQINYEEGVVVDPTRAATSLWNAGIFPTKRMSHLATWPF
ncbi:hypothetical protein JL721_2365 [Aureococcus anophagefferens]|nr:hypothetical protein JL721_2365 [Aureococcus anophagefferens]